MRRYAVLLVATLALVGIATPAGAVWKGQVCKVFDGPDGPGQDRFRLQACAQVDDHDFEDKIRGYFYWANGGTDRVEVHVSYARLIRNGNTVREVGPYTFIEQPDNTSVFDATTYYNNPSGIFWTRIRMWVCWPTAAGNPCGGVVIWNSGDVGYI